VSNETENFLNFSINIIISNEFLCKQISTSLKLTDGRNADEG